MRHNGYDRTAEDKTGKFWFDANVGIHHYLSNHDPGNLWFGTYGGVYRYDGKSFLYLPLPDADVESQFEPSSRSNLLNPYSVYCLFEDKAGNVWFGTESRGVCRYDGTSFTWFTEKGLSGSAVRSIFKDKRGNMWFGNNGGGVYCYDGKSLTNFTDEKKLGNPDFLKTLKGKPGTLARVWTIAEDKNGNLWFGTIDAGAWRYDGKSLTNFTTKDGLTSNAINTIYKDKAGTLWFGTDGGGVCKYDGKSFINFTRKLTQQE
ncbi:MAG TPA: two-component regulator propeller domain-containing protein [Bacteroidota bacterium]|nr:two-component regulator propeller domain-containing protein [Bacteroidota bacterium]